MMGLFRQSRMPEAQRAPADQARTPIEIEGGDFIGRDLSGHDFANKTVRNANFDHSTLDGANLMAANFVGCTFNGASLSKATLRRATFDNCQFNRARVDSADAREAVFVASATISYAEAGDRQPKLDSPGTAFDESIISGSNFAGASLVRAVLNDVKALNVNFRDARLEGAVFDRCEIAGSNFMGAKLQGADFSLCPGARRVLPEPALAVVAFLKSIDQPTLDRHLDAHQRWLASNGRDGQRLVLTVMDLTRKTVRGRDLSGADLRNCRLDEARLHDTRLIATDLRGASLNGTVFRSCDLRGAKLDAKAILKMKLDDSRL